MLDGVMTVGLHEKSIMFFSLEKCVKFIGLEGYVAAYLILTFLSRIIET